MNALHSTCHKTSPKCCLLLHVLGSLSIPFLDLKDYEGCMIASYYVYQHEKSQCYCTANKYYSILQLYSEY